MHRRRHCRLLSADVPAPFFVPLKRGCESRKVCRPCGCESATCPCKTSLVATLQAVPRPGQDSNTSQSALEAALWPKRKPSRTTGPSGAWHSARSRQPALVSFAKRAALSVKHRCTQVLNRSLSRRGQGDQSVEDTGVVCTEGGPAAVWPAARGGSVCARREAGRAGTGGGCTASRKEKAAC